jgi:hypothetical protein
LTPFASHVATSEKSPAMFSPAVSCPTKSQSPRARQVTTPEPVVPDRLHDVVGRRLHEPAFPECPRCQSQLFRGWQRLLRFPNLVFELHCRTPFYLTVSLLSARPFPLSTEPQSSSGGRRPHCGRYAKRSRNHCANGRGQAVNGRWFGVDAPVDETGRWCPRGIRTL